MAMMIRREYEALKEADASEEKAPKAAGAIAASATRFAKIEADFILLRWIVGYLVAATTAVMRRVFAL
ncbi:MAG: integrase [Candidatus Binatia bacterium]|nr:integrase [Candidatus Binatia bacterium]